MPSIRPGSLGWSHFRLFSGDDFEESEGCGAWWWVDEGGVWGDAEVWGCLRGSGGVERGEVGVWGGCDDDGVFTAEVRWATIHTTKPRVKIRGYNE